MTRSDALAPPHAEVSANSAQHIFEEFDLANVEPKLRGPALATVHSAFSRFLSVLRHRAAHSAKGPCAPSKVLFPCDLPFPEAEGDPLVPKSGRRRNRYYRERAARRWINEVFAYFSYLEFGCPKDSGWQSRLGPPGIAPLAVQRALLMLPEARQFCRPNAPSGPLGGARLRAVDALKRCITERYRSSGDVAPDIAAAEFVDVPNLSVPARAGVVDIETLLTDEQRAEYLNISEFVVPEAEMEQPPKPCHRVHKCDEDALAELLLDHDMAVLVPEGDLPRDPRGKPMVGGFFCVRKVNGKLRLIYDRRPLNSCEKRFFWVVLPAAAMLTKTVLDRDEVLRGSGRDLKDYYFYLAHSSSRIPRNGVGRRVSKRVADKYTKTKFCGKPGGVRGGPLRLAMRVAGMGDLNTVDIATACHENLLGRFGIDVRNLLRYGKLLPKGRLWTGIYIDDLLVLHRISRRACKGPGPDTEIIRRATDAYQSVGIPESTEKGFNQELDFKVWGRKSEEAKALLARRWLLGARLLSFHSPLHAWGGHRPLCSSRFLVYSRPSWSFAVSSSVFYITFSNMSIV